MTLRGYWRTLSCPNATAWADMPVVAPRVDVEVISATFVTELTTL